MARNRRDLERIRAPIKAPPRLLGTPSIPRLSDRLTVVRVDVRPGRSPVPHYRRPLWSRLVALGTCDDSSLKMAEKT